MSPHTWTDRELSLKTTGAHWRVQLLLAGEAHANGRPVAEPTLVFYRLDNAGPYAEENGGWFHQAVSVKRVQKTVLLSSAITLSGYNGQGEASPYAIMPWDLAEILEWAEARLEDLQ